MPDPISVSGAGPLFIRDPRSPLFTVAPSLPGQSAVFDGRGGHYENMDHVPTTRGTLRVAFTRPSFVPTGPLKFIAGASADGSGYGVIALDTGEIVAAYSLNNVNQFVAITASVIPAGTPVVVTFSWDSENPIDGPNYGKFILDGYPTAFLTPITPAPWAAVLPSRFLIGGLDFTTIDTWAPVETFISPVVLGRRPL